MSPSDVDPAMEQWVKLLGLTTNLMLSTDAVMEVFAGYLNREVKDRDAALAEIARRTVAYRDARKAVIVYAQALEGELARAASRGSG